MAGKISGEKIQQLQDAFNKFADERGLVKTRNMERVLRHMGENPAKADVQDMINEVDGERKGAIEFDESSI